MGKKLRRVHEPENVAVIASLTKKISEFMARKGLPQPLKPRIDDKAYLLNRSCIMMEEVGELFKAINENDMVETADAIGDVLFTVYGLALAMGMAPEKLAHAVANSNLTKTDLNAHSKGGKGQGYVAPTAEIRRLLSTWGWSDPNAQQDLPLAPQHTK